MAYIEERKRQDGSVVYVAHLVIKRNGKIVFRQARSCDSEKIAKNWVKKKTKEVEAAGSNVASLRFKKVTLSDAIEVYISRSRKAMGKTKAQVLHSIQDYDIGRMRCVDIESTDVVAFAEELSAGRDPSTVGNYLSHLGSVFKLAQPAWKIPLSNNAFKDAVIVCKHLGLIGKSKSRNRRPTLNELDRLLTLFEKKSLSRPNVTPMHKIVGFALFSTRRQGEIVRITNDDFLRDEKRIWVRDMKHPGDKIGNDVLCGLPEPAFKIACSMQIGKKEIFPYHADTVSTAFTRACHFLEIDDLRFHDLRHEGISRLFEMGNTIPQVADVSGHRDWASLKRYTHLAEVGDKYKDWPWIDRLSI